MHIWIRLSHHDNTYDHRTCNNSRAVNLSKSNSAQKKRPIPSLHAASSQAGTNKDVVCITPQTSEIGHSAECSGSHPTLKLPPERMIGICSDAVRR